MANPDTTTSNSPRSGSGPSRSCSTSRAPRLAANRCRARSSIGAERSRHTAATASGRDLEDDGGQLAVTAAEVQHPLDVLGQRLDELRLAGLPSASRFTRPTYSSTFSWSCHVCGASLTPVTRRDRPGPSSDSGYAIILRACPSASAIRPRGGAPDPTSARGADGRCPARDRTRHRGPAGGARSTSATRWIGSSRRAATGSSLDAAPGWASIAPRSVSRSASRPRAPRLLEADVAGLHASRRP